MPTFVDRGGKGKGHSGYKAYIGSLPPGVTAAHIRRWIARAMRAADWQDEHGRVTATEQIVADPFRNDP
eukprot:3220529-Alexandrium_andersonii.AAC.1